MLTTLFNTLAEAFPSTSEQGTSDSIGALYARPSDNIARYAVPSWVAGTAATGYPVTNVITLEPDVPAKVTETYAVLKLAFAGPVSLAGFAVININCPGVTIMLTNNGTMTPQIVTVPDPEDGLCINAWFDLRGVDGATASQWSLQINNSVAVAIGTVMALAQLRELRNRWDYDIVEEAPVITHRTSLGKRVQYRTGTRIRRFAAEALLAEDRNDLRSLRRSADGTLTPFFLVPYEADDDVLLVQFADPQWKETYRFHTGNFATGSVEGNVDQAFDVEEVNAGVAL